MGNKNSSSFSKKQTRSQIYQQEQLNRIEREIQESNSIISLKSSFHSQYVDDDNNLIGQSNQTIFNPWEMNSQFQSKEDKTLLNDHSNDVPIGDLKQNKASDRKTSSLNRQYMSGLNANMHLNESERKETKIIITELENHLSSLIRKENYFGALEKLFEILFLNKKAYGSNSEQVAFTMHRMSSILCLLGRLEEALKYEYESCQVRKSILGGLDVNIAKSMIYIAKLLWYFKKYIQSFYYILEAYNISEHPSNRLHLELKSMVGEVSLEMSNIAHENEQFILSFKLRILSFQSKRSAFLIDESYLDDDIIMLAHEVWSYKQGIFLLQMIPTRVFPLNLTNAQTNLSSNQEESCPICYIEFNPGDQQKELLCNHIFHPLCIDRWIIKNQKCPMCRKNQDLKEYLNYQQNRRQNFELDQSENQQQKQIKKAKCNNQNHVTEIIQLSPRTSATFDFLQSELQNQEIDIFMFDYNQHFNILPLTSHDNAHNSNNNISQSDKNDSNQNDVKPKNNLKQNKIQLQKASSLNSDDQQLKERQNQKSIKERFNHSNSYNEFQFTNESNQQKTFNPGNNNQNINVNLKPINQQQSLQQFDDNQEYEEEEESKHNYTDNYDQESSYYNKKDYFYEKDCNNLRVSDVFIKDTNDKIIEYQNIPGSHQIQSLQSDYNFYEENKQSMQQNNRQNYYSPIREKFPGQQNFKASIQQFKLNDEINENKDIFGEYGDENNDFLDESQNIIQIKQIKHSKQFLNNNIPEKNSLLDLSQEIDFRNKGQTDESLFIEQNSLCIQPQIKDSMNPKQLQNRYLYFEQDQQVQDNAIQGEKEQQEFRNPITFKDPKFQCQFNQISSNTKQQHTSSIPVTSIKGKQCSQSCYCCKNIDDEDVNFDEEGISESNNQIYIFGDKKKDNKSSTSSIQQRLQSNIQFKFENSNNSLQKNLAQNLSMSCIFKQKQQAQDEKLTINNMPFFLSKNISNNSNNIDNNGQQQIENTDIFDRKPFSKFNIQKIDLFEDEEKENKFFFDNNIINNNKYMNHY